MVAVISGNGLGLGNTSQRALGGQGGPAVLGQSGAANDVNITTGNLILQGADEGMLFDGLSLSAVRTYNSLGQLSGSNGWSYGFSRNVGGLTGTVDTAGSTVTRTDDDGSSVVYTYDATRGVYVSTSQSGAVDTLSWNSGSTTWTWSDAASQRQETYNATGQLTTLSDPATGASYSFDYSGGQLSQIVAGDGDTVLFGYNTSNQLISLSVQEVPPGQTTAVTRQTVTYGYDSQGRLSTVTTTLASDTNSSSTASYTTTYGYDGTSDRVTSVTQSDGTVVSYAYTEDAAGVYQVTGITTGTGAAAQTLALSYAIGSTTVTDGLGNATTYQYNAAGELTAVVAPAVNGVSPTTAYTYDSQGNVLTMADPNGAVTTYTYDAQGNRLSVQDGAGHAVSYTYDAQDQVTSQTVYTVPAQGVPGQSGYVAPSGAQTTYYVYDAAEQLACTLDALGHATEYDYTTTAAGLSELTTVRHYLGASYDMSGLSPSTPPTLAQLQAYASSSAVQATLGQTTRIDYTYDVRGQLATQTQYDTVDANGNGVLTNGTVITTTTYDARGRLLQTSTETGANRSTLQTTSYAYDGLGRVVSKTDPLNNVTTYVYTDSASTIAITQANGLTTTQVRNSAGLLLSSTQSASGQANRVTSYLYNADGEPVAAIDPNGNASYTFYDADGRIAGTVDADGGVTAYTYDADGRVIGTTQYATPVSTSGWVSSGALTASLPVSLPVPASNAADRTSHTLFDAAGRVIATIDPEGNVTTTTYDGEGHAIAQTAYATALTSAQLTALGSAPTWAALQADLTASSSDRTTRTVYDATGRAVASIDAAGYVTVTTYDDAGRAVKTVASATALTTAQLTALSSTPTLAALQADLSTNASDQITRTYYDGEGRPAAQIDADGYLTTTGYDETTDTTTTTRYATVLTSAQLAALTGTETVATLVGLLGSNTTNETSSVTTNADGEVVSRTAVDGTVTTYAYNAVGQVLSTTVTPTTGQGAARTTSATYDAFGDTLTTTDAANATTTYTYNALGQQVTATDALGNSTWSYYDADGRRLYTIQGQPSGTTLNALGSVTAYTYNAFGEVVGTTTYAASLTLITSGTSSGTSLNPAGATAAQVAAAVTALGAVSGDANAVAVTSYTLDGQVAATTDGDGYQTANTYDAFGDVMSVQQQLSQPGSALTASNSTLSTYTYDARGARLTETNGVGTSVARTTARICDAFGRVTSRTDGNGNTVTYSYDNLGRQVSTSQTVQGAARATQTTYDAFGHVLTETDALGNVTQYQYNPATHTSTVTTPDGVTMTTVTDAFGDKVDVTDGAGNTTAYSYDGDGRLLTTTDALGNISKNQYDVDGNLFQATDATGHVVTYTYDASGRVLTQTVDPSGLALTTNRSYDAQGRTLSVTDPSGTVTTYSYDADGRTLTQVVNAGTNQLNLTTTYTYDGEGKTLTVTTGAGTGAALTTQYVYDNLERLSQAIVAPGTLNLTTHYAYDANNNLVSKTDANGNVTRYVYDEANEQVFTIDPTGAVTQNWYDADGRLTTTRGYLTLLTAAQLSALGNTPTVAAVSADITATNNDSYRQSVYNANGQVVYLFHGVGLNATQYIYDRAGHVTQTRVYANQPSANAWTLTSFNPVAAPATVAALLTASSNDLVTTTAYNASGEAVYTIDGAGDVTQTVYDKAGRVSQTITYATVLTSAQITGLGSTPTVAQVAALITSGANDRAAYTSYDSAGRAAYGVAASGAVTLTTYDASGRVTSTHAYATTLTSAQLASLGSTPTPAQIAALVATSASDAVSYKVYDSAGDLRYSIDPMGYVTETRYNAAGQVTETLAYATAVNTSSEAGALQAGTALGWVGTQVGGATGSNADNTAQATLNLYDAAGRQVLTVRQNGNGTMGQVAGVTYDANGNVLAQTVYGNTLTLSASEALSAQLTTASVASAVAAFTSMETTTNVYDADNRAIYTIDALGDVTQKTYDAVGHLIETQQYANSITLPGTINASTIAAAVAAAGTSGSRVNTVSYDSRGDVIATGDALGTNATYGYDGRGLKTSSTNRDGATWYYTYDGTGRLVQTQGPSVTVGSYSVANGQLQTTTNQYLYTTNTYDAFGDLTGTRQGYGASASAVTAASTTSYTYDATGRRVSTTNALNNTSTVTYNALGQVVVSKDASGNFTYSIYNAGGQRVNSVDGNGYVTAYTYDAYGNILTTTQCATVLNTSAITGWSAGQPLSEAQLQQGLVASSSDRTTVTTYDQLNQKTEVVLPSITYDLATGPVAGTTTTGSPTTAYTYDAYGNVTSSAVLIQGAYGSGANATPAIWATTYTYYDALNRAVMVVTPTGNYASPQGYVTKTVYNAFGNVSTKTEYAQAISTAGISTGILPGSPGAATVASGADRVTTYTYDAIGRVLTQTLNGTWNYLGGTVGALNGAVGYASGSSVTGYTYNGENRVLTETVNGATTTTTYDALGRVMTVTAPARNALVSNWQSLLESSASDDLTTAALYASVSPVTTYVYDALGNAVSTSISAGGLTQQGYAAYNALGQQTESIDANGNAHTTIYDANGNVLTTSYTLTTGVTVTTTNTYDADNQRLSTAVKRSNASTNDNFIQQRYNAFGEVIAKGDGNVSGANGGWEAQYTYNNAGQQITAPSTTTGAIHSFCYDLAGQLVVDSSLVTGGAAQTWTHNWLDLGGSIVQQRTPSTEAASGVNASTQVTYTYDRWGNVLSETDANGNTTTYHYDSQSHLIQQLEANVLAVSATGVYTWVSPTKEWYYNIDGELIGTTDENSNTSWYAYDAAGHQTMAQDNAGAQTRTAYDALGRAVATETPPVQSATSTISNISYAAYNSLNQVTGQGYFALNSNGTTRSQVSQEAYVLNAHGDRVATYDGIGSAYLQNGDTTDAAKYAITYTYDSQHRVLTSTTPLNETTTYAYDVNGNLIHQTYADGYTQSWAYNYFGQVQSHVDQSGATYTYSYDANSGLMTQQTSNWMAPGPSANTTSTLTYSYEASGQMAGLTEVVTVGSGTVTLTYGFGYDANGNETQETISTLDGGGNAVKTALVVGYDSHNRLQEVTDENTSGSTPVATMRTVYVYDEAGNRRAVFASSGYGANGVAATAIPLTTGAPTLTAALANQTVSVSGTAFAAMSYNVTGNFTDPLGMGLTYTETGLPSWLSLNSSTGVISGTPPVPTAPTSYTVTITATDVLGRSISGSFTVTVPTLAPIFNSAPAGQTAQPGAAWSYVAPAATDVNGYGITYSASGMPTGISFNASTRTFSGTTTTGGSYTVTYIATPGTGPSTSTTFTITVPYVAPVFSGSASNQTVQPGASLNYTAPAATDANGYGVIYSASGLPSGISFNATTRTFSGSLTTNGTYTVTYTAQPSTGSGASVSQTFTITVPAVTPVFSGGMANQSATASLAMSNYTAPTASDANGAVITYSASGMPAGVGFNASTRTFSGTPTTAGTYTVTYTATSADGPLASATFTISVAAASPPVATGGAVADFTLGISGTAQPVTFSNPMGRALSYSISANSAGLSMNGSGGLVYDGYTNGNTIDAVVAITATDTVDGLSCVQNVTVTISTGNGRRGAYPPVTSAVIATPAVIAAATPAPAPNVQADWFTYDADNRVVVADGSLQNGSIVINETTNSGANVYDAAGDVIQYTSLNNSGAQTVQKNYYTQLGRLAMVQTTAPGGTTFGAYESRSYDADGRLIQDVIYNAPLSTETTTSGSFNDAGWVRSDTVYTYNADGELTDQSEYAEESAANLISAYGSNVTTSTYATADKTAPASLPTVGAAMDGSALYLATENSYIASSGYGYDADGNVLGYHTITGSEGTVLNASPTSGTVGYQNTYVKQNGLLLATTTEVPASGSSTVTTGNAYNDLGELAYTTSLVNGVTQTQDLAYTAGGQLLQKSVISGGATTTTYYESVNEHQLGSTTTAGAINVLSTTGGFSNSASGTQSYTVQVGDTLQALAQEIYGDSNYYYILAQANGLSTTATLTAGMMLHIPQVTTTANASGTYQPYSAGNDISGGAAGLETAAEMIALSVNAIFNQQSAIAQTVAQVEAQAKQEAAIQQQMEQEQAAANQAKQAAAQEQQLAAQAQANAEQAQQQAAQIQQQAMQAQQQARQAQSQARDAAYYQAELSAAASAPTRPESAQDGLWAAELGAVQNELKAEEAAGKIPTSINYGYSPKLAVGLGVEARGFNPDVTNAAPLSAGLMVQESDGFGVVSMPSSGQGSDWAAAANALANSGYSLATGGPGTGGSDQPSDASGDSGNPGLDSFSGGTAEYDVAASSDTSALSDYTSLSQQATTLDQEASSLDAEYSSLEAQSADLITQSASLMTQSSSDQAQSSTDQNNYDVAQSQYATSQNQMGQAQTAMAQLNSNLDSQDSSGGDLPPISVDTSINISIPASSLALTTINDTADTAIGSPLNPVSTPQMAASGYASYGGSASTSGNWNLGDDSYLQGGPVADEFAGIQSNSESALASSTDGSGSVLQLPGGGAPVVAPGAVNVSEPDALTQNIIDYAAADNLGFMGNWRGGATDQSGGSDSILLPSGVSLSTSPSDAPIEGAWTVTPTGATWHPNQALPAASDQLPQPIANASGLYPWQQEYVDNQNAINQLNDFQKNNGNQVFKVMAAPAVAGATFGLGGAFLGGDVLLQASVTGGLPGAVSGYRSDGLEGAGIGFVVGTATGVAAPAAAGAVSDALTVYGPSAQFFGSGATFVSANAIAGGGGTMIANYASGKPLFQGVGYGMALGATAPLMSGESAVVAYGGVSVVGDTVADGFSLYTGAWNIAGSYLDPTQEGDAPSQTQSIRQATGGVGIAHPERPPYFFPEGQ